MRDLTHALPFLRRRTAWLRPVATALALSCGALPAHWPSASQSARLIPLASRAGKSAVLDRAVMRAYIPGQYPTRHMLHALPLWEGNCMDKPVLALTAACVRACRVAVGSQAHLLMDAAEQGFRVLETSCARACRVAMGSQAHLSLLMDAAEQGLGFCKTECACACRVAMGSQAHLNLLMDAAEQVGGALDHMHSMNVAHLDIKVSAPSAAQLERLQ